MLSETREYKKKIQRRYNVKKILGREVTKAEDRLLDIITPNELFVLIEARDCLRGVGEFNPLITDFFNE